jgi:hypothetical protein
MWAWLIYLILLVAGARGFQLLLSVRTDPMPVLLELDLMVLAAMFAAGGGFLGFLLRRTWSTAYAVTDQRLLIAVGQRRDRIRNIALADLALVRIVARPRVGKMLFFYKIPPALRSGPAGVFTLLETAESLSWKPPWTPSDAESVGQVIETARANITADAINRVREKLGLASWFPVDARQPK